MTPYILFNPGQRRRPYAPPLRRVHLGIIIGDCTGETVNEFGLGHPDDPAMPLGQVLLIAQGDLGCAR